MGRDAGISFHGLERNRHGIFCDCPACEAQRELKRMEFKKIAVRAEAAELHKRNEAQAAFIAGLAGLCLLAGIFYWGALWIYNTPTLAYSAPNETGLDPILFLQALGMDPWAIAVPCGGTPLLLAVAGYVASDLRFEKCWKARARRKLRVLRKDTLADAKQLMKERRR